MATVKTVIQHFNKEKDKNKVEKRNLSILLLYSQKIEGQDKPKNSKFRFSTKMALPLKYWKGNGKGEHTVNYKAGSEKYQYLNDEIKELEEVTLQVYNGLINKGVVVTNDMIRTALLKKVRNNKEKTLAVENSSYTILQYIEAFIKVAPKRLVDGKKATDDAKPVRQSTITSYGNTKRHIELFDKDLTFADFDKNSYNKFKMFLLEDLKIARSTAGVAIKNLKNFAKYAQNDEELNISLEVNPFIFSKKCAVIVNDEEISEIKEVYLSPQEVIKLYKHDFTNEPLYDVVRDWFIVAIWAGARISDFLRFNNSMVDGDVLTFTQKKVGGKRIRLVFDWKVKAIREKYNGNFPPVVFEQKFNNRIKDVCEAIGMTQKVEGMLKVDGKGSKVKGIYEKYKLVSSHTARRTMATNRYKAGEPMTTIMKDGGWSKESTFLGYIKITEEEHLENQRALLVEREKREMQLLESIDEPNLKVVG